MTFKELFDTLEQSSINGLGNQEIHIPMDIYFKLKKEYIEKTDSPDEERFIYSTEYFRQKSENHMQKLKELHRYSLIPKSSTLQPPLSYTFNIKNEPTIVIDQYGFKYKGEIIANKSEVYKMFNNYINYYKDIEKQEQVREEIKNKSEEIDQISPVDFLYKELRLWFDEEGLLELLFKRAKKMEDEKIAQLKERIDDLENQLLEMGERN